MSSVSSAIHPVNVELSNCTGTLTIRDSLPADWFESPPLFEASHPVEQSVRAQGWIGADHEGVRFRVVVHHPVNTNHGSAWYVVNGDCIEVSLRTPQLWEAGQERHFACAFGLTDNGPDAWTAGHWLPGTSGQQLQILQSLAHDDAAGRTVYDIALPWDHLGVSHDSLPCVDIACMCHLDGHWHWFGFGEARDNFVPGWTHRRMELVSADTPKASVTALRTEVAAAGDCCAWLVHGPRDAAVAVRCADREFEHVAAEADRHVVTVTLPNPPVEPMEAMVEVRGKADVLCEARSTITNSFSVFQEFASCTHELALRASHPLVAKSLSAMGDYVSGVGHAVLISHDKGYQMRSLRDARERLSKLRNEEPVEWEEYRTGVRPLVGVFSSEYDGSLQTFTYRPPCPWDESRAYPLMVDLHGAGDHPSPLDAAHVLADPTNDLSDPRTQCFHLTPHARGNLCYEGAGLADVLESVVAIERMFLIDTERRYLTGFSMGGYGTWTVAAKTPDMWAALAPGSCFWEGTYHTLSSLVPNLAHIPMWVYCGEFDAAETARRIVAAARERGIGIRYTEGKGLGHSAPRELTDPIRAWLLEHRRVRPDEFSFTCVERLYRTCYGIKVMGDVWTRPSFACRIDDTTVHIDCPDPEGVEADLGQDGLGFTGEVAVVYNGEEKYRGEASKIRLGGNDQ